jgi:preprotein translocase subunit SecB
MKAVMQFKDYHVLETFYKSNPNFDGEETKLSPNIHYDLRFQNDSLQSAEIDLSVSLGDENLEKNSFFVKAKIRGHFIIQGDILKEPEKVIRFYKENGLAILFPYIRSLISDLTSKGSEIPIILPTINIVEMIRRKEGNISNKKSE